MPDNPELTPEAIAIHDAATTLATHTEAAAVTIAEALTSIDDDLSLLRRQMFPGPRQPRVTPSPAWPWSPGTQNQGFLSNRWERRDGDTYGTPARAGPSRQATYPIRGGDDAQSKVDVPSGARRS